MTKRNLTLTLLGLLAATVLGGMGLAAHLLLPKTADHFRATMVETPDFAMGWSPATGVVDHNGTPRLLGDYKGQVVLLFFGYTQCPDVCPTALHRATQVMAQLGEQAKDVQVLFMTLDPKRDTTKLLAQYVPAFDKRFVGLRPNPEAVPDIAKLFRVFYQINPGRTPSTYTLDHGVTTYAYNRKGHLRLAISHSASAEDVTADVRTLLTE